MKLGIFVGSFNPVHKGHIEIVKYILKNKYVDKVLIVPTGNYWNKKDLIDIKLRIKMLEKYNLKNVIIEKELNNLNYTYELMRKLKEKYKNTDLSLIIGADNIVNFDKWKNYKELLNYELIIYKRDNIDIKYYLKKLNKKDKYIVIDNVSNINISSSKIKEILNSYYSLDNMLDKKILKFIIDNKLYKNNSNK